MFVPDHNESTCTAVRIHEVFSVLKVWKARCAGTYKCLREKLDEFSVFAGRNPMVIAGDTKRKQRSKPKTHVAQIQWNSNLSQSINKDNEEELFQTTALKTSDKPTLDLLQVLKHGKMRVKVIESVAAEWEQLAIALGFGPAVIDYLRRDFRHDSKGAATEALTKWLNGESDELDLPITWDTLIQCLEDSKHVGLAETLVDLLQPNDP